MIPILDWRRFADGTDRDGFVSDLGRACRETGFFLLSRHTVSGSLIEETFRAADTFFAMPAHAKADLDIRRIGANRGWSGEGTENLDDTRPGEIDRKEAFNIGFDLPDGDPRQSQPFRGRNAWPEIEGFRNAAEAYFSAVLDLGRALHRPIALDLGLPEHHFASAFDAPLATLRMLRYPPGREGLGAGAHTDYGSLTLLMTDGEPGLQVRPRNGGWIDVPHVPDAFVVNIADCLMRWTNDVYVSTPHRVRAPARVRRSLAFFLDPNPDARIAALPGTGAPKYPPITGAEYLRTRLDATYSAGDPT